MEGNIFRFIVWLYLLAFQLCVCIREICPTTIRTLPCKEEEGNIFDIYQWRDVRGRRRLLSIYFARILDSFFILWTPYLLAPWLAGGKPWAMWTTSIWGHLQDAISAGLRD